jgi:hypothetical protein
MVNILLVREPQTEIEKKFLANFESAAVRLLGSPGKQGRSTKSGAGEEQAYAIAYKSLLLTGLVYPLKKKYRKL